MSEMAEIKGLVENINPVLVELRKEVDEVKVRDGIAEEKFGKMADEITKGMEALQEKQAKIEAAMRRPSTDGGKDPAAERKAKQDFERFLRTNNAPDGIKASLAEGIEVRAMATFDNPNGGYLVRPEFADFIIGRVFESSPVRQVSRQITLGGNEIEVIVDDNQAGFYWGSEGGATPDSDTPHIGRRRIVAHKLVAYPSITTEMAQDAVIDVEAWLRDHVADRITRGENSAFVAGNGSDKPRGFLTYPAWAAAGVYERDKIERRNIGSGVTAPGLIRQKGDLKELYQPTAVWGMQRQTYAKILTLAGADQFFFGPLLMRDGQATAQLLGKQVLFMDDMEALGAGALVTVYGDFSRGYTVVDRMGLQVLVDPYTTKGFIKYYTTKRTGGDVTNFDALKIGVDSN
jgi:HK97 family phage major capsid protein